MPQQRSSFVIRMKHLMMMMMMLLLLLDTTQSFTIVSPPPRQSLRITTTTTTTSTQLFFFGNGPKDDGSPGDYVCKDCGYVFTKGPAAWAALPDNYSCPPCGSPKRRFTKVPKGGATKSAKKTEEPPKKKSWF